MQVVDLDQGGTLARIPHAGRDYVAGQPGHRFSVRMQNLTGERVLAVLSVDGVNAISGQTASASQAGYVLEPWQQRRDSRLAQELFGHRRVLFHRRCPTAMPRAPGARRTSA